ncbi:hypothetical protein KCU96_g18791, partial [Aureobasidium melanogenum]
MPRSSKRQTRLTFDPLPTSSPAPSDMSKSVRDRAATVRFEGANPAKRRKVRDVLGAPSLASAITPDVPEKSLPPTPDPTNSFGASVVSDDEIRPTQRLSSRKSQKKQQKLDLTPSSPRAINNARPVRAGFFGTQQQAEADSSDESDSLPKLPIKSQKKKKSKHQKKHKSSSPAVEEEEEVVQSLPAVISDDDESEDDLPTTPAVNRKRKRQAESSSPLALIPDDEDDD